MLKEIIKDILKDELKSNEGDIGSFTNENVLVRANNFGVNVGEYSGCDGVFITLVNCRKLWRWKAKKGIALESVASNGIADGTKATAIVSTVRIPIKDVCGIISIDSKSVYSEIMSWPVAEQS